MNSDYNRFEFICQKCVRKKFVAEHWKNFFFKKAKKPLERILNTIHSYSFIQFEDSLLFQANNLWFNKIFNISLHITYLYVRY